MIHGLDTSFLVAVEMRGHPDHSRARSTLARFLACGDRIAIVPQVLAEFQHVVTDPRRFKAFLTPAAALSLSEQWWAASEVMQIFPTAGAVQQYFDWLRRFALGRKRQLDTLLAATFHQAGISSVFTLNPSDFAVFGVFTCLTPGS